jgi:predicted RND superfamily exporter protein
VNMSFYGNDTLSYTLFSNNEKGRIKKYVDQFNLNNPSNQGMSMKELVDTNSTILRIRCQVKDLGSYEILNYRDVWKKKIDAVMNPDKITWEKYYAKILKGDKSYIDSMMTNYNEIRNEYVAIIAKNNPDLEMQLDTNEQLLTSYYKKPDFTSKLRQAVNNQYFDVSFTGTSVVAADGTRHLVNNLFSSLVFAIVSIAILMALLFRSWRMVVISMVPNLIPLVVTGGIMGYFGVPLKPSTLLVFSIAFGISVDDTIHYLAKYRQELKSQKWNLKECVLIAIKESGLGMFYTSIVLYCGFSVFLFSQFGGTQALGLLISVTLLVAMITNLIVLPSLLLTLDRFINLKAFKEPYFDAYDEDYDIDWSSLQLTTDKEEED